MLTDNKNSIWLSIQFIVVALIYLITLKINILNYGDHDFGIWIVAVSIWSFSFNLDFGIGTTVVRYVAKYKLSEKDKINGFISTSFCIFLIAGVILIVLGCIASYFFVFSNTRIVPIGRRSHFVPAILLYGLAFIIQYIIFFYKSIFDGFGDFVTSSKFTITQNIMILFGIVVIWILDCSLIYLSLVYVVVHMTILISYILLLREKHHSIKIKFRLYDKKYLKEILVFSFSIQTINLLYSLIDVVVKNFIANYYQASFATVYETARRFALAISGLFFNTFKYILPKASALSKKEEIDEFLRKDIINYTKYGLTYSGFAYGVMAFPLLVFIQCFFAKPEIMFIFLILSMPEVVNNGGYSLYNFILAQGKVHLLTLIQFTNLLLTASGAMYGFVVLKNPTGLLCYFCSVVLGNCLMLLYVKKRYKIPVLWLLKEIKIYKLILFEMILFTAILILFYKMLNIYLLFSIISVVSLIIYGKEIFTYVFIMFNGLLTHRNKE